MADNKRGILFLPGIKLEDCEENLLRDEDDGLTYGEDPLIADEISIMKDTYTEYEELPNWFIDFEHWPKSTNLLCLSCGLAFQGTPWFIPVTWQKQLVPRDSNGVFLPPDTPDLGQSPLKAIEADVMRPFTVFCLPLCAKRYLRRVQDPKIISVWESEQMLEHVVNKFYGLREDRIALPEAEDKNVMIQHVGKRGITPAAFRELNEKRLQEFLRKCKKKTAPESST
jgi:hypothetical protein